MDRIDLPWLEPQASVSEAIGRIIEIKAATGAAAVVTKGEDGPVILRLERLLAAGRDNPKTPLYQIQSFGRGTYLPGSMRSAALADDFGAMENALDSAQADFGVIPLFGGTVRVVTRHETIAAEFRTDLRVCRCTGPYGHVILAGDLDEAGQCNYDEFPVICA